jgi:hypothetical protein
MSGSNNQWVVDRNGNLVNLQDVISVVIAADSNNASLWTVHLNAYDPTGSYAGTGVAELTTNTDGTGMATEADAVVLLQSLAELIGVVTFGPAVGAGY